MSDVQGGSFIKGFTQAQQGDAAERNSFTAQRNADTALRRVQDEDNRATIARNVKQGDVFLAQAEKLTRAVQLIENDPKNRGKDLTATKQIAREAANTAAKFYAAAGFSPDAIQARTGTGALDLGAQAATLVPAAQAAATAGATAQAQANVANAPANVEGAANRAGALAEATQGEQLRTVQVRAPNGDIVDILMRGSEVVRELGRGPNRQEQLTGEIPSPRPKEFAELDETEINLRAFVRTVDQTKGLIREGGPSALSAAGATANAFQQIRATAVGGAQLFGVDVEKFDDGTAALNADKKAEDIFDRLGVAGSLNAQIKSNIVELAFAAAASVGQTGRGVSDKDFDRFVRRLAAGAANPDVFIQVLDNVTADLNARFVDRQKVMGRRNKAIRDRPVVDVLREQSGATQPPAGAPTATDKSGNRVFFDGTKWVLFK